MIIDCFFEFIEFIKKRFMSHFFLNESQIISIEYLL